MLPFRAGSPSTGMTAFLTRGSRVQIVGLTVVFLLLNALVLMGLPSDSLPVPARAAAAELTEVSVNNPVGVVLIVGTSPDRGGTCSAVPVNGTNMLVSAAHCVLASDGMNTLYSNLSVRDPGSDALLGLVKAVRFDHRYLDDLEPRFDLAVLYTDRVWSTGVDAVEPLQTSQDVLVYALQRVRGHGWYLTTDGEFWRYAVVRCAARELPVPDPADGMFNVPCGLVPGASGAPVVVDIDGRTTLVGVLSTASSDGDNGIGVSDGVLDLIAGSSGIHVELGAGLLPELAQNRNVADGWWLLVELIDYVGQESSMGATVLRGAVPAWRGGVLELHLSAQVRRRLDVASEKSQDRFFAALDRYRDEVGITVVVVG
jgi:hypothetical protein